ncbi:MAG: hypothetical protein Q7J30_00080 [Candidatus Azambacteria bacterium]|nr:hypothetical protein [Candidatus Azambacteria bacterium]
MKKVYLLLGAAVVFSTIFYLFLVSVPHPMGLWRLLVLMVLGATGLWAIYEALYEFYGACRMTIISRQLRRRIQEKGELFQKSCQTP